MTEDLLQPLEAALAEEQTVSEEPSALSAAEAAQEKAMQPEELPTDVTRRLAEEFFVLREEFPTVHSPEQLPDEVLNMAAEKNIPLLDAYLRFRHEEEKRIMREEARRREAAACSAGSLLQGATDSHPEQEAFLRAFRTALK